MISCKLIGGLGNQMFQIATTQALALANNVECCFADSYTPNQGNNALSYRDTIFNKVYLTEKVIRAGYHCKEPHFTYNPLPFEDMMVLSGYFQSPKYFDKYRNEILDLFLWKEKVDKIKNDLVELLKNSVSLHVRRGDYIGNPNLEVLGRQYYYLAEKYIFENGGFDNLLIFSDDIPWARENFPKDAIYIRNLEDYEEMYLMSLCNHNIIANSSFSWWGAYLNKNPEKIVTAPKKWFKEGSGLSSKDIYTNKMIVI